MNFVTFSKPVPKHIFKARATLPLNADAEQSFISQNYKHWICFKASGDLNSISRAQTLYGELRVMLY